MRVRLPARDPRDDRDHGRPNVSGQLGYAARIDATPDIPGYEIAELLGQGSFARVYAAIDPAGREVALKVLAAWERGEQDLLGRVAREVEVLGSVSHPGLVPLLAHHLEPPVRFLVFPRYRGGDLEQRLTRGPLATHEVLALGEQLAGALAALHAAGVVHRDVKPANVFLDAAGRPVLGDLGLARGADHVPLTTQGLAVGSLGFMAPEVRRGDPATAASDVFSLGVLLWEGAGGARPAVTAREVIFGPEARPSGLTPASEALVRRMLDPDPDRRPDAAAIQRALREAEDAPEDLVTVSLALDEAARQQEAARRAVAARATPAPLAPRLPARELGIGLALLLVGLGLGVASRSAPPPPAPSPPAPAPVRTDLTALVKDLEPALDEEARRLAAGAPGRPGQAHVLAWLAAGNDPGKLPELVRQRLRQHDERLRTAGEAAVFTPLLEAEAAAPGSARARALAARAAALGVARDPAGGYAP